MKKLNKGLAAIVLALFSFPVLAFHCPVDMKKIDAALENNTSLSAENMSRVNTLRASGEKMHKSGSHQESVDDLADAMKLLGIK